MFIPFTLLGFGRGVIVPVMTSALLADVDKKQSGIAPGTLNTSRQLGSVMGVAILGSLIVHGRLVGSLRAALTVSLCLIACAAALVRGC